MIGAWVLIIIQMSGNGYNYPQVNVQTIYFHTKAACEEVAVEFNPDKAPTPRKGASMGATCRPTGAP